MPNYILTKKAVEDLAKIWDYTFDKWSEKQADKYYKSLLDSCQYIAENPDMGKKYENVKNDLWGHKTNLHIIFYRKVYDKPMEIVRILHQRMDLKNRISE